MKLLLIQPSDFFVNREYESPPLGLAYLAAIAEQRGWQVRIIVASTLYAHLSDEQILSESIHFAADVIGIRILTFSANKSYKLIKELSCVSPFIIAGGHHATVLPEEVLNRSPCNIVVRGEGEETFNELLDLFEKRKTSFTHIKGISFKDEKGRIFHNPDRELLSEVVLNKLVFPAKHLFSKKYFKSSLFGNIIASRGCPHFCTYCSQNIFKVTYRIRNVDNVFAEIEELYRRYKVRYIFFADDLFTANEIWVKALCEKISESKISFAWTCSTRIDCVTENLLREMKKAGCLYIQYGVESISPYSYKKIRKKVEEKDVRQVLSWSKDIGIGIVLNFMWGFPWDTRDDIKRQIEFINGVSHKTYFTDLFGIIPFPGTELYNEYNEKYNFKDWWLNDNLYRKEFHLFQSINNYFPHHDQPFFNLTPAIMTMIKKAYDVIDADLMYFYYMIRKVKGKYIIISRSGLDRSLSFIIRKSIKLFFIKSSKLISYVSPELELRLWVPFYKFIKKLDTLISSKFDK